MDTFKSKILSRKFLITALTVALAVANGDINQAVAVAVAYLGVQGVLDHKAL